MNGTILDRCWITGVLAGVVMGVAAASHAEETTPLEMLESLKQEAIQLNRDIFVLEEDLLYPAETRIGVFLALDVGFFFQLDSVRLTLDDQQVAGHLYTERQVEALNRGGIEQLYLGNLRAGTHVLKAVFTGIGPNQRPYKRAVEHTFTKAEGARYIQLTVTDSTGKLQPEFRVTEW